MCITCGCDEPEDNHGDPRHITLSQFRQAAEAAEVDMRQLLQNIEQGLRRHGGVQ
ncbi:MAG: hypothetical protein NZ695_01720 [Dehalococcoidia bacterium]|jgi:hypothetical protein|nr:hypothetical protein [Dehalococcoidia bacterium]MDW8009269.1 hypothetical protein [Chloroflexota bacterium]GBD14010.1 hypothetical protein HRbin24_02059 [bacterium HR24]